MPDGTVVIRLLGRRAARRCQRSADPETPTMSRTRIASVRPLARASLWLLSGLLILAGPGWVAEGTAAGPVFIVPIEGEINDIVRDSIQRRVDQARANGAKTIVFKMHTPGGLVTSALDISKLIKKLPDEGVRTVAWVDDQAYSAGALISVASQEIVMAPAASLGDCAPIMVTPVGGLEDLGQTERAKAESPILQEFRDSAARNGYDQLLCRAMVTVGTETWWIEGADRSERRFVDNAEKKRLIDDAPADERAWKLVESYQTARGGAVIPLDQPIDRENELLTVGTDEAVAFGLARAVVSNVDELSAYLQSGTPVLLNQSGWETFALWLNSPLVRGILFVIMLIGGYLEFQSPGLLAPGVVALIALTIFLAAPYAAGLADVWTILVLAVGVVLLAVELFILPGFGIAGISGIVLILVALVGTFVPGEPGAPPFSLPTLQGTWDALRTGILVLALSITVSAFGILLLARFLPEIAARRGLFMRPAEGASSPVPDPYASIAREGDIGLVVAPLRPGGQARFGIHVVDVSSQGEFVDSGRKIQVLSRNGPTILVRPLPDDVT